MLYWVLKVVLTPLIRLLFRVESLGAEHVPATGGAILASNHRSFIDSIFIPFVVPRRVTFVAKAEYFESRRTAWFFHAVGMIPIRREGGSASRGALDAATELLIDGGVLGIYPEGTRSPDGRLYRGHTGVARLALQTGSPVVPVACSGTHKVQPIGSLRPKPFLRVRVEMGEPLRWEVPDRTALDPEMLRKVTDEVMQAIRALSGQDLVDAYANRLRPGRLT